VHFIVDLRVARPVESNATIVHGPDNTITVLFDKWNIMLIFDFGASGARCAAHRTQERPVLVVRLMPPNQSHTNCSGDF
jgi:alpha/beta superfamily hydrolase